MKLTHSQGLEGENIALHFLLEQGCQLIARNWHCPYGEIDLIMQFQDILLFIEVKYRKNNQFGGVQYSIGKKKLTKLCNSIEYYLQKNQINKVCRLDAVLIEGAHLPIWIQNITG